jgi:hypothetical protein
MTAGFMGWLQRNTIQAAGGIAATAGNDVIAPQRIRPVLRQTRHQGAASGTPTNHHRANVLRAVWRAHALKHGGAIG